MTKFIVISASAVRDVRNSKEVDLEWLKTRRKFEEEHILYHLGELRPEVEGY
jgi:hypothetical protein